MPRPRCHLWEIIAYSADYAASTKYCNNRSGAIDGKWITGADYCVYLSPRCLAPV